MCNDSKRWAVAALLMLLLTASVSANTRHARTFGKDDDGWFEIRPGGRADTPGSSGEAPPTAHGSDTASALPWIIRAGDTLGAIAQRMTGDADNAQHIAELNAIGDPDQIDVGETVWIPSALMRTTDTPAAARLARFEMQSFPVRSRSSTRDKAADTSASAGSVIADTPSPVPARRLELFSGEVRVLGEVSVTRVAVGNGGVLRAEVLASGELLLIGESPGSTSLHLWHSDGSQSAFNLHVYGQDPVPRFPIEPMVTMKVRIVEFRKSALGKLGIDWSAEAAGPAAAIAGDVISNSLYRPLQEGAVQGLPQAVEPFASYLGIASSISSRIHFLASTGDAVTLAEPVLSCANGGTAEFLAGGEIPYPIATSDGQTTVEFKDYGIGLKVSPRVDGAGNVQTLIQTEISQIDPAVSVQGAPGLLTRRTQTQVNVKAGETIVLAGLISSEQSRDVNEVPGLGRLPLLGSLFRSKSLRDTATELVVFVTPEVHAPGVVPAVDASHDRLRGEGDRLIERARRRLPVLD